MHIVYTGEEAPTTFTKSIFLAGPSPRKETDPNWRPTAIRLLELLGYDGVVFAPIWRNGPPNESGAPFDYDGQVEWERDNMNRSDVIVFWVPRSMRNAPALTTNVEYGMWIASGKIVLGFPDDAEHMKYLDWQAIKGGVPTYNALRPMLVDVVARLGTGAPRTGGERDVPLHLWAKPEFQSWLKTQKSVGNRLDGAQVVWTFRVGERKERVFLWALHVDVWVAAEDRHKTNEVAIFRPDVSTIVAYCLPPNPKQPIDLDTEVVLIREFRSPGNNGTAMVHEVPGGSSLKPGRPPEATASDEFQEETGLSLSANRFDFIGARQVAATLSPYRAFTYAVALTPDEMLRLKWEKGQPHGNHADTEYTFVDVQTVQDILDTGLVDWANLGMIFQALATTGG